MIGENFSISNAYIPLPQHRYTSYSDYQNLEDALLTYLDIESEFINALSDKPTMTFYELPSKNDLNAISLISTDNSLTGLLTITGETISTTGLEGTLRRSPLLQNNAYYSLYYALQIGGRFIELGHETSQMFVGQNLVFQGNIAFDIPKDLMLGNYQLVCFYAKVVNEFYLRVSNPVAWEFENLVNSNIIVLNELDETAIKIDILNHQDSLLLSVSSTDGFAPKVTLGYDEVVYQFEETIDELLIPEGTTVEDFLNHISILDNYDGMIEPDINHLTKNDEAVLLSDLLVDGVWTYEVSDSSGLTTKITILVVTTGYSVTWMVDDEIYEQIIVSPDSIITQIPVPEKLGHTIVGWDSENLFISNHQVYHAVYTVNVYKVTWVYQDEVIRDEDVLFGTELIGPEMENIEGHLFVWQFDDGGTMPAGDLVINGQYERQVYTIVYIIDGVFYMIQEVLFGDPIVPPDVTPKEGLVFTGWDLIYTEMPASHIAAHGSFVEPEAS